MRRATARGFTFIEMFVTLAVIGVLATMAVAYSRYGLVNASVSESAYELSLRISGLRSTAMAENRDYLLVVADAQANDPASCSWGNRTRCVQLFVLYSPASDWKLADFNPASPATKASVDETLTFSRGVAFDLASTPARPAPFSAVPLRDGDLTASCLTDRKCFALRFRPTGEVVPEYAGDTRPPKVGYAFVIGAPEGSEHRGMVVSFPTGIVKTFAF